MKREFILPFAMPLLALGSILMVAGACSDGAKADVPATEAVRALTGAPTRVVWIQHTGKGEDTYGKTSEYRLMQFDTEGGERVLLGEVGSYAKPMITPKGDRVVYSSYQTKRVYVVGWDGKNVRDLGAGTAVDTWADPASGVEWVYVQTESRDDASPIVRWQIDDPSVSEQAWNQTPVSAHDHGSFHLSADGTKAAGLFPWPDAGLASLPNGGWTKLGGGCWSSIAPDNSYLSWIFDGAHQNVFLHAPGVRDPWRVPLNGAPGIASGQEVYHPRWSNHPRFFAMTGPYEEGRVQAGGRAVEVYLGGFAPDYAAVAQWVQVSRNESADYFPDVWVENGAGATVDLAATPAGKQRSGGAAAPETQWPLDRKGLLFLWANNGESNEVADGKGGSRFYKVTETGRAVYGKRREMMPEGGSFVVGGEIGQALAEIAKSGEFTIEALVTAEREPRFEGEAGVISVESEKGALFQLVQEGREISVRLTTDKSRETVLEAYKIKDGNPHHVAVTFDKKGELSLYVDGRRRARDKEVKGDIGSWRPASLRFGSGSFEQPGWAGHLEGVAIYSRAFDKEEVERHAGHFEQALANRQGESPLIVEARLVSSLRSPSAKEIEPYRRALVVHTYEVEKVLRGSFDEKKLSVAHWTMLDARPLEAREIGRRFRLRVEPFTDHPQLEGERLIVDDDDLEAVLFYAVGSDSL